MLIDVFVQNEAGSDLKNYHEMLNGQQPTLWFHDVPTSDTAHVMEDPRMSFLKGIDSKLMRLLTYNFWYPDWSQAPLYFPVLLSTLYVIMAVLSVVPVFRYPAYNHYFDWSLGAFWLVLALYHFRLWRQLKSDRS